MAFRTWVRLLLATLGVGALAGASQLGVAYGLGIVRLTRVLDVTTRDQWTAQLAWVAWFAMMAAVVGALAGAWLLPRWSPTRPGTGTIVAIALAAGAGAAVVVPLTMQPARTAQIAGVHPVFVIGVCAGLGALAGVFAAVAALIQPVSRWSLSALGIAVWVLAIVSVSPSLAPDDPLPAVRLGVFDAGFLSPGVTQRTALFTMPALALIAGAVLGWAARRQERPMLTIALAGLPGPALLTAAYLIAGPGSGSERYQVVPYWAAMTATGAGVLGSVLAAVLRRGVPEEDAADDEPAAPAVDRPPLPRRTGQSESAIAQAAAPRPDPVDAPQPPVPSQRPASAPVSPTESDGPAPESTPAGRPRKWGRRSGPADVPAPEPGEWPTGQDKPRRPQTLGDTTAAVPAAANAPARPAANPPAMPTGNAPAMPAGNAPAMPTGNAQSGLTGNARSKPTANTRPANAGGNAPANRAGQHAATEPKAPTPWAAEEWSAERKAAEPWPATPTPTPPPYVPAPATRPLPPEALPAEPPETPSRGANTRLGRSLRPFSRGHADHPTGEFNLAQPVDRPARHHAEAVPAVEPEAEQSGGRKRRGWRRGKAAEPIEQAEPLVNTRPAPDPVKPEAFRPFPGGPVKQETARPFAGSPVKQETARPFAGGPVRDDRTPAPRPFATEPQTISAPIATPEPITPPIATPEPVLPPTADKRRGAKQNRQDDDYVDWVSGLGSE